MRLFLLRHAKSSWDDPDLADHDRPLAPRGARDAARLGAYLDREDIRPALVVCSSGLRARQTLAGVLPSLGPELDVRIEPALYTFDPGALLERVLSIPDGVGSAMLVGHNPAIQELALAVAREGADLEELRSKYPSGALAEITLPEMRWRDVAPGAGVLTRFVKPRALA